MRLTHFGLAALAFCYGLGVTTPSLALSTDPLGVNKALGMNISNPTSTTPPSYAAPAPNQSNAAATASLANAPQTQDYQANINSDVFGANLFSGAFAKQGVTQFNPDYAITIGDQIEVKLWGAFEFSALLTVDPKGNIFIPHAGPVAVVGVKNQDIQRVVTGAVSRVFKNNVNSYASLAAAQPVRVFVGGFVNRPGLYSGTSLDSLLHYIDQAGGIDANRGSFLQVEVKRGAQLRAKVNLYDFILQGVMPQVQLADGDVVFITPRQHTTKVQGLVENAKRFEFDTASNLSLSQLMTLAKPLASATHVRVMRNTGNVQNIEYYSLQQAAEVFITNGDEVAFTADKKPGTITVRVEGEHLSAQEYVLPYGSRVGDLIQHIQYSERSDVASLQLFRQTVKERQKLMLSTALKSLESAALTARSATSDEARLRADEANLILQWVERARSIEPTGQVVIAGTSQKDNLLLENGDVLRVPSKDGLVLVSGEVLFPNAVAFDSRFSADDYVKLAGGYTQNADNARIIVAHRDGRFANLSEYDEPIRMGDEILVLPKIDTKSVQITKDLTQVLYQIAVSAKVVLGL